MLFHRVLRKNSLLHQTNAKSLVKIVSSATFRLNYSSNSGKNNDHIALDFGTSKINVASMDKNNLPKVIHTQPFLLPVKSPVGHGNAVIVLRHLIGRKFDDSAVHKLLKGQVFSLFEGPNGDVRLKTEDGLSVSPTVLLRNYFEKAKKGAESCLGNSVCSRAVITNPSVFDGEQLREIVKAGLGAGFELIHSIDETTATAIAYGMHKKEKGRLFVVVDIGFRSFDVTLMEISDGGKIKFKCPTKTDMHFGGDDFDIALFDYFVSVFDVSDETKSLARAKMWNYTKFAENQKKILSSEFEVELKYPLSVPGQPTRNLIDMKFSRSMFENIVNPLIVRIKSQIESYLEETGTNPMNIDEVLLVGGMAKVPKIRKVVSQIFGKIPSRGFNNLDEVVALGAAAAVDTGYFGEDPWNNN